MVLTGLLFSEVVKHFGVVANQLREGLYNGELLAVRL